MITLPANTLIQQLQLSDLNGRLLQNWSGFGAEIQLPDLASGVYLLSYQGTDARGVIRLVVQ